MKPEGAEAIQGIIDCVADRNNRTIVATDYFMETFLPGKIFRYVGDFCYRRVAEDYRFVVKNKIVGEGVGVDSESDEGEQKVIADKQLVINN